MAKLLVSVLICGLSLTSGAAWGQAKKSSTSKTAAISKSSSSGPENKIVCYFPPMPDYKDGGGEGLMRFIATNTRYPAGHHESGRVYISFVVTETGKVSDVRVQKGFGKPFDEEAVRVVKLLGDFTLPMERGMSRRIPYTVPVFFPPKTKVE